MKEKKTKSGKDNNKLTYTNNTTENTEKPFFKPQRNPITVMMNVFYLSAQGKIYTISYLPTIHPSVQ